MEEINTQESVEPVEQTESPKEFKKSFNPFLIVGALIILVVIGYFIMTTSKKPSIPRGVTDSLQTTQDTVIGISIDEVSKHASKDDCWFVIEGNVYNVSSFVPKHPGEDAILLGCGKDATEMFNKRPNDGTSHSDRARVQLENYKIGVLSSS